MMRPTPQTWRMVKLGVCLQRRKDTVLPATLSDASIGLVGLEDIQDGGRGGVTIRQTKPQEIESLKTRFVAGDILYGKLRPYLNKVGIAPQSGLCSTEIWAFGPSALVDSRFAMFFLASSFFVDRVASLTKGANLPRLDTNAFDSIEIPLPPLSEQHRTVEILQEAEEIRRLCSEAEAKTAELAPTIFEGVFGDPVRNPRKWSIQPLAALINDTPKNGLYKPADLYGDGTPIIRIGDFTGGILRNSKALQRVRIADNEIEQFGVANGQILINRVNSIEHLGKSLLVASLTEPTVYESNMMRLDPKLDMVVPEFLIGCLQHPSIVAKLRARSKRAVQQASINQTDVLTLQIPVPPIATQRTFAANIAEIEQLRTSGEQSFRSERALSAALSAHAFSGQLTADWREAKQDQLAREVVERDTAIKEAGATVSIIRRPTMQDEIDAMLQDRTDGIYSDLNREQHDLMREIKRMVGGVEYGRYFTADQLASYVKGPLHRHPQKIETHLTVFAVRGIIIPVSRPRSENTGPSFAACYRLPVNGLPSSGNDAEAGQNASDDIRTMLMAAQRKLAKGNL
jgi:type I restriction enzyme, S subunit